jgi:DNA-binding transcriptional LysR family regulator
MKRLDWNHLEYFRVTGRLQHVTRAAQLLNISQPALSRALAQFERNLGVPVFEHVGRAIRLTSHGETFLRRIERAHGEIEEARLELMEIAAPDRGTIALGFLRSLGTHYVPHLVRRFSSRFPDVSFTFMQNNSAILSDHLLKGEVDLIITALPVQSPKFSWARVADQELVLIVPRGHRLARRGAIGLSEAAGEKFVSYKPDHAMRRLTDALCRSAGFVPSFSFEGDDSSSVPGFVAAGFGVAIVPAETGRFPGIVSLRLVKPAARRAIGVACMTDRFLSASAKNFRDFAVEAGRQSKASTQKKKARLNEPRFSAEHR